VQFMWWIRNLHFIGNIISHTSLLIQTSRRNKLLKPLGFDLLVENVNQQ